MALSNEQIISLAKPIVEKMQNIVNFYENPKNEQEYREWYKSKYGQYPDDKGVRSNV